MTETIFMKGNEALSEAAIRAGCNFYAGYPITPQSEISEYMSREMRNKGKNYIAAESEIAAINMIMGAGAAGGIAMTSSSSCAISLIQESLSYMVSQENPCVIVNVSRAGPGLGSISPSQGDYNQVTKTGANGDVRFIVFAPSTVQESVDLTYKAFYLSQKYRTPTMILSDGLIGQIAEPVLFPEKSFDYPDTSSWALSGADNRPPRKITSVFLKDNEHEEHLNKLFSKFKDIEDNECMCETMFTDDAELVITAFGSCARITKTAIEKAREQGYKVGLIRPITVWPFPSKTIYDISSKCKVMLDIEMNMGQMVSDVKLAVKPGTIVEQYCRSGGHIPKPKELLQKIIEVYNQHCKK